VLLIAVLEGADVTKRAIGSVVLGLSACGYPLTQLVIRRWGVRERPSLVAGRIPAAPFGVLAA
jgi:hypothetical protein